MKNKYLATSFKIIAQLMSVLRRLAVFVLTNILKYSKVFLKFSFEFSKKYLGLTFDIIKKELEKKKASNKSNSSVNFGKLFNKTFSKPSNKSSNKSFKIFSFWKKDYNKQDSPTMFGKEQSSNSSFNNSFNTTSTFGNSSNASNTSSSYGFRNSTPQKTRQKNYRQKLFTTNSPLIPEINIIPKKDFENNNNATFFGRILHFLNPHRVWSLIDWSKLYSFSWIRGVNRQLVKFDVNKNFGKITFFGILTFLVGGFLYFSIIDTSAVINRYQVTFSDNSYLNINQLNKITEDLKDDKVLGFVPNNNYFFVNSNNITKIAQKNFGFVSKVEVVSKEYPNLARLSITTYPASHSLLVKVNNQEEVWLIGDSGEILGQDLSGKKNNLIIVNKPFEINITNPKTGQELVSFGELNLNQYSNFLNKIKLVNQIKKTAQALNIPIQKILFLSILDGEVTVEVGGAGGSSTELFFDTSLTSPEVGIAKFENILQSQNLDNKNETYYNKLKKNELKYIDFRINRKVYVCDRGAKCDITAKPLDQNLKKPQN